MEPVYCPNGHPNRPGTRLCAVCRALIEPDAAPAVVPAEPDVPEPIAQESPRAYRWWTWLLALGLLLLLMGLVLALLLAFYPLRREGRDAGSGSLSAATARADASPPATATAAPASSAAPPAADLSSNSTTSGSPAPEVTLSPTAVATITPFATDAGSPVATSPATPDETGAGLDLLQNGSFADDWRDGWGRESRSATGVQDVAVRPAEELGGLSLRLEQTGAGLLRVSQEVALSEASDSLSFRGHIRALGTYAAGIEGRALVALVYENDRGEPLGASVWLDGSASTTSLWDNVLLPAFGPMVASRTLGADGWRTLEVSLAREFSGRLPGIDPAEVRQITVILALLGSDDCEPEACAVTLDVADLSLTADAVD